MLYFLTFSFYYDDKEQQLRWPSEESNRFISCQLGYNSEFRETKDSKISILTASLFEAQC